MGYRVKNQCFDSFENAMDYVMSDVQPVLTSDGQVLTASKSGNKWYFQGTEIVLVFPECSYKQQISEGLQFGFMFVSVFALMFCFKTVYRFMNKGVSDDS